MPPQTKALLIAIREKEVAISRSLSETGFLELDAGRACTSGAHQQGVLHNNMGCLHCCCVAGTNQRAECAPLGCALTRSTALLTMASCSSFNAMVTECRKEVRGNGLPRGAEQHRCTQEVAPVECWTNGTQHVSMRIDRLIFTIHSAASSGNTKCSGDWPASTAQFAATLSMDVRSSGTNCAGMCYCTGWVGIGSGCNGYLSNTEHIRVGGYGRQGPRDNLSKREENGAGRGTKIRISGGAEANCN